MKLRAVVCALSLLLASCGHGAASSEGKWYVNLNFITHGWSWLYLRDGKAYEGGGTMPTGGPDKFDPTSYGEKYPNAVADYQLTADKLVRTYMNGKKLEETAKKDDADGLLLDGMPWARLLPLGDGTPLEGTFEWIFSAAGIEGASTITYEKNGQFTVHVVAGITNSDPLSGGKVDAKHHGTYSVQGFMMTMKSNDGTTQTFPAGTTDSGASALYLETSVRNRSK